MAARRLWRHAEQLAAAKVPFIFDPGQQLPMFDGAELRRLIDESTWVRSERLPKPACSASAPA